MATRLTLGEIRKLQDRELANALYFQPESGSIIRQVIADRMVRDGYVDFFKWIWDLTAPYKLKSGVGYYVVALTAKGETLKRELEEIVASGYDFSGLNDPERCREFCSKRGNVWRLREDQLSLPQAGMLGLIRDRANRFLRNKARQ